MFDAPTAKADTDKEPKPNFLADIGYGFLDSAARPVLGLLHPDKDPLANRYNHDSIGATIGEFGGAGVDIVALSKLTGLAVGKGLSMGAEAGLPESIAGRNVLKSALSMGTAGFLYGSTSPYGSRFKNGTIDALTFGTLGASSAALESSSLPFLGKASGDGIVRSIAVGGLSGIPAGLAHEAVFNANYHNSKPAYAKSVGDYTALGAFMVGLA
jgi:hypothetical protein